MTVEQYIHPEQVLGYTYQPGTFRYTERDVSLYALGVGAAEDGLDPAELPFVFERHAEGFKTLPFLGVLFPQQGLRGGRIPGLQYNLENGLHGEEYLEVQKPLPTSGTISCEGRIAAVYDKGSGVVLVTQATSRDENGAMLAVHESSVFIRGLGGFGGDRGPSGKFNLPPDRAPDGVHKQKIAENQALIYRLSGDTNPLHIDPAVSGRGGFPRPILHGLCTLAFGGRAILKHYADNDVSRFKSIKVRFANPVLPGDTLITEMWSESPTRIVFACRAAERDGYVLTNAAVELYA